MGIRLCISGIGGRMGQKVARLAKTDPQISSVVGIEAEVPVPTEELFSFSLLDQALIRADVLLGFTNSPEAAVEQAKYATEHGIPVVVATTGLSSEQVASLQESSQKAPIIRASNFSLGINLLAQLVYQVAKALPFKYDIEIVEEHHGRKLDAPSGTANMLAGTICQAWELDPKDVIECGRAGRSKKPRRHDIVGVQTVRAGNIAGNHEVIVAGPSEVLRFRHEAQSPEVFAEGALTAVKWIIGKKPGWYTMAQVLGLE